MIIKEVLAHTTEFFKKNGLPQPQLDAEVLLADLLDMERIQLYVNFDLPLKDEELSTFRKTIRQRAADRVPVAYLTGHKEFMSLDFKVNNNVLIPRPETEILVEEVIGFCDDQGLKEPNIVDLGTGSGAIAVSLGYYLKGARIVGIDISDAALQVAQMNINRYEMSRRIKVIKGDLLNPLIKMKKDNVDVVLSNPPYISDDELEGLPPEVKNEPGQALAGGPEGLDYYKKIIPQSRQVLISGGLLALEIGRDQAEQVRGIFGEGWERVEVKKDHAGRDRVILAVNSGN